jgi:hypothetical protein
MYTAKIIGMREVAPSKDLWTFAARYGFRDLEKTCRSNVFVFRDLLGELATSGKGLTWLANAHNIPMNGFEPLIVDIITKRFMHGEIGDGHTGCREGFFEPGLLCSTCKKPTSTGHKWK